MLMGVVLAVSTAGCVRVGARFNFSGHQGEVEVEAEEVFHYVLRARDGNHIE